MPAISRILEPANFRRLATKSEYLSNLCSGIENLRGIGLTQKDIILRTIAQNENGGFIEACKRMYNELLRGANFADAVAEVKRFLPNSAAIKKTSLGTAVMAEGWSKPIVFPNKGNFKMLGWADVPYKVTTKALWKGAYGKQPPLVLGAVGNSNIKPEQVKGGCSLSKQELSAKYEDAIQEFYTPIIRYLKEQGAKAEGIGFAFAHSDCGVDRAARNIVEKHKLKGFGVTPTEYTQYVRGKDMPATAEFPDGYILADFPFPTVLTRNISQIEDYAHVYGKMVGKDNPLGVFGGGEHAFVRDVKEATIGQGGARCIPVDIMKDMYNIVIPAVNERGIVTNAARYMLERVDGNPYTQYTYAFENFLPSSKLKEEIRQYPPRAAITTIAYSRLAKAGKIGK